MPVLDLQSSSMLTRLKNTSGETPENNAILKAQEYGRTMAMATGKEISGRLMTYQEARNIDI